MHILGYFNKPVGLWPWFKSLLNVKYLLEHLVILSREIGAGVSPHVVTSAVA